MAEGNTKRMLVVTLLAASLAVAQPGIIHGQVDPSEPTRAGDAIEQQLEAVREQKALYTQQQGDLQQQADLSEDGLADAEAQAAKLRAEVELSNRRLDDISAKVALMKKQRALAIQEAYMNSKDNSIFYALVSSRSLSEFLSRGEYTGFLLDKKNASLEEIDAVLKRLDRERRDIVTKKNAFESEMASLHKRIAEIKSALAENTANLEAASRLEAYLAGSTGNFNRNDRPFLKNNSPIGDRYTFEGGGTEHGLGMSQYGAKGAAQRGKNYKEILSHYYLETTVKNVGSFSVSGQGNSEDYLARVVEGEMNSNWPMEALKAQAVAARSYAYANAGNQDCTPRTQYCAPSGSVGQRVREAVNATKGEVLVFGGQVVPAYFHSTSGGWTENNENVWGGSPLPWLRGVPSPWETDSPHWDWKTASYTKQQMQDILNRDSRTAIGELQTIKIVGRGVSGRVTSMQIVGSAGTKTVSGPRFKTIFNNHTPPGDPILKSTMFGFI